MTWKILNTKVRYPRVRGLKINKVQLRKIVEKMLGFVPQPNLRTGLKSSKPPTLQKKVRGLKIS